MDGQYIHVLALVTGFLTNVFSQIVSHRWVFGRSFMKPVFLGFVLGFVALSAVEFASLGESGRLSEEFWGYVATNILIYGLFSYGYFHFLLLGETSLRVRILNEVCLSPDGLSLEEILKRYNGREIVSVRIQRMLNNHQLKKVNGKLYVDKPTLLGIARIIVLMKFLLLGERSDLTTFR